MIQATELKAGITFQIDGKPYKVIKFAHSKIGRGGANVKVSLRNLQNGNLEEKTFNSNHKFEEISTVKKQLQFLYHDSEIATFMNPKSFDQIEISAKTLGDDLAYIREGQEVDVLFWGEKPLSVEIPPNVILKVDETAPGVKGNTSTNAYKPARLENGLEVKVPLFIKTGDKIKVDTRTGEYVERASA